MEKVKEVMTAMGVLPKLRLGLKVKGGGVKSTGAHRVKFLSEPEGVTKKNFEGKPTKFLRFEVECHNTRYHWFVSVLNKEGNDANYLIERLAEVKIGDERILEMTKQGAKNFIDVREVDAPATVPDDYEGDDDDGEEGTIE
jgi:hypothetical protein